jgi:hypothetical protein
MERETRIYESPHPSPHLDNFYSQARKEGKGKIRIHFRRTEVKVQSQDNIRRR